MRFLLDHDVPNQIGVALRRAGQSVLLLREVLPMQTADAEILKFGMSTEAIVITCNRQDFLALCAIHEHFGVIILVRRQSRMAECNAILNLIERAGESGLVRNINFA